MKYSLIKFVSLITELFPKHKNVSADYRFTSLRPYVSAPLYRLPVCLRPYVGFRHHHLVSVKNTELLLNLFF